jgi:hypothetical protein
MSSFEDLCVLAAAVGRKRTRITSSARRGWKQPSPRSLAEMPERCSIAENKEFSFEVRHLLYGRKPHVYRAVFTIEGDTVYILHLWHSRRKLI